jgi:hypothetical protein
VQLYHQTADTGPLPIKPRSSPATLEMGRATKQSTRSKERVKTGSDGPKARGRYGRAESENQRMARKM